MYDNLLRDINLEANSIPLLVGELVNADQNGACSGMNEIIRTLPDVIPNACIIPSDGCEGVADRLHFSAEGYRELGRRYAKQMLTLYK
ncbi:sialate O-acetylesterase [Dysgonomonas termitidis]|uniref:Sialate O-acetylesterase n=1 Tax=Dysgonomonas termitidis TaxID=1516126 RepID=A0ABV9KRC7_9BACT